MMKVLTIKQPFASLIALGEKRIETRSWKTNYRGPLYIHAGKSKEDKFLFNRYPFKDAFEKHGIYSFEELSFGMIIAKADLIDCIKVKCYDSGNRMAIAADNSVIAEGNEYTFGYYNNEAEDRYAWVLDNVQLIEPISAKGQLGLWNFDGE